MGTSTQVLCRPSHTTETSGQPNRRKSASTDSPGNSTFPSHSLAIQHIVSDIGFSLQVNAYSPSGTEPTAAQQYGVTITGNSISGFIDNWRDVATLVVCDNFGLASTPLSNGLPAGYSLLVGLLNDASGNVTAANYQVFDDKGNQLANSTVNVQNAACNCGILGPPCLGFQPGDLSPMSSFTVDLVGPDNSQTTTFSSGAGSIRYNVWSAPIFPVNSTPLCVELDFGTAEQSNVSYGTLNSCPPANLYTTILDTPNDPMKESRSTPTPQGEKVMIEPGLVLPLGGICDDFSEIAPTPSAPNDHCCVPPPCAIRRVHRIACFF